jgi:PAS domain S-box-containing protein
MTGALSGRTGLATELLDQLADIVVEFESDGRIAFVNRAVEREIGLPPRFLTGRSFFEIVAPEDRERLLAEFRKLVESGGERTLAFHVMRHDGLRIALDSSFRAYATADGESRVTAVCRDVTHRASATTVDLLRHAQYRALVESGIQATAIATASGAVRFANRRFHEILADVAHIEDLIPRVRFGQRRALENTWFESTREHGPNAGSIDLELPDAAPGRRFITLRWSAFQSDTEERLFAIQCVEIERQAQVERLLAELALGIDANDPERLEALAGNLAAALGLDRVVLARHSSRSPDACDTIIHWQDGEALPRGTIRITGLPEATAIRGEVCVHPAGVTRLLPSVADEVGPDFESFAGAGLVDSEGRVVGLLGGYSRKRIENPERIRDLLAVVSKPLARALARTPAAPPRSAGDSGSSGSGRSNASPGSVARAAPQLGQDLFERVVQESADLVFLCDLDTTILFANEGATRVLHANGSQDAPGRALLDLLTPLDAQRLRSEIIPSLTEHHPYRGELTLQATGDALEVPTEARIFLVPDQARGRVHLAACLRDVSARRRAEEALRESEVRLGQSRKMESVGRLAGGIAHDFNNLLTAIIGYSDLVLQELDPGHATRRDVEEILRAAERAAGLTRQLLAFSRRQVLQPERVDLNAIVADIDRMLRRLIGEDIELVSQLSGELEPILADPGQIEQVIVNLVVNARDAMPRGGRLALETANFSCSVPLRVESGLLAPGSYVVLRVTDTGTGMDEATRSQIFEPFFTTKRDAGGTGLGLASVYGIISQSRGQIDVTSRLGEGTCFTIYLPKAGVEEAAAAPDERPVPQRGRETILVVEDSGPVRRLVDRTLSLRGYNVLVAESATAALRHCSRHPGTIDLLLTDVVLPRMPGPEIARRARQLRPGLRVLFMSGFTDETLAQHGLTSATPDLLEKPFSSAAVLARVRMALDAPLDGAESGADPDPDDEAFLVEHLLQDRPLEE